MHNSILALLFHLSAQLTHAPLSSFLSFAIFSVPICTVTPTETHMHPEPISPEEGVGL